MALDAIRCLAQVDVDDSGCGAGKLRIHTFTAGGTASNDPGFTPLVP